ncbi:MAG: hypothetical protein R2749_01445 [Acidimicrobiales bacterium]
MGRSLPPRLDYLAHALFIWSGMADSTTYRLVEAASKLDLSVPATLQLCFGGQLELRRIGPYDALRITKRSVDRYLAQPH